MKKLSKKDGKIYVLLIGVVTPILIWMVANALTMLAVSIPEQKVKSLLNIAFMDNMKQTPKSGTGLNITKADIDKDHTGKTYSTGKIDIPSFGEQYAVLSCEAKSFEVPVYWGSTDELLEHGACQSTGSVVIGEKGNVVIDAHVDTYFDKLDTLNEGDELVLYTDYGKFTYKIDKSIAFMKTDKSYVTPKATDCLTLYTCKREVLGASDARTGFTCSLVKKEFYSPLDDETETEEETK